MTNLQKDVRLQSIAEALRRETKANGVVILVFREDRPLELVCLTDTTLPPEKLGKIFTHLGGTIAPALANEPPVPVKHDAQGNLLL